MASLSRVPRTSPRLKLMVLRMQILQSVGAAAADVVDVVIG
jgi:hypothetical protein